MVSCLRAIYYLSDHGSKKEREKDRSSSALADAEVKERERGRKRRGERDAVSCLRAICYYRFLPPLLEANDRKHH